MLTSYSSLSILVYNLFEFSDCVRLQMLELVRDPVDELKDIAIKLKWKKYSWKNSNK